MTDAADILEQERQQLRQSLLAQRHDTTEAYRQHAAQAVQSACLSLIEPGSTVAAYLAFGQELSVTDLLTRLRQNHCRTLVPIVEAEHRLRFVEWHDNMPMRQNRYGIAEPDCADDEDVPISQMDNVLVPLTGCDHQGYRMGMGGGYYDRHFEQRPVVAGVTRPILIGLAYDFQYVETVLPASWDIRLDVIVTDKRIIRPPAPA